MKAGDDVVMTCTEESSSDDDEDVTSLAVSPADHSLDNQNVSPGCKVAAVCDVPAVCPVNTSVPTCRHGNVSVSSAEGSPSAAADEQAIGLSGDITESRAETRAPAGHVRSLGERLSSSSSTSSASMNYTQSADVTVSGLFTS